MRSMWKGSISFGLVTIPVKLYAATESRDLKFNLLHEACRTPVQYRKWCPHCDREVAGEEIVKGFEYERGRYVTVTEEEIKGIPVAAAHTLEIVDFVRLEEIDPIYFDRTYYLEPGEGGARAYALLRRAMAETGRIALARVVIRTRESLAAIRVFQGGVLALETMHFPEEIRSPAGLTAITEPELKPQEVEMAVNLISSLSGTFEPAKFENRYREALLELIEAKVAGEEVVQPEAPPDRGTVVDLMTALRASIQQAESARQGEGGTQREAPAAAPALPEVPTAAPHTPGTIPAAPGIPGHAPPVPGVPAAGPGAQAAPGAGPGAPAFPAAGLGAPSVPASGPVNPVVPGAGPGVLGRPPASREPRTPPVPTFVPSPGPNAPGTRPDQQP